MKGASMYGLKTSGWPYTMISLILKNCSGAEIFPITLSLRRNAIATSNDMVLPAPPSITKVFNRLVRVKSPTIMVWSGVPTSRRYRF